MEKVRVLYCIETLKSGGVEQRRYTLAKFLDKSRFEVKIICTQAKGSLVDQIIKENVEVIEIGKLTKVWQWNRYSAVLDVIKSFKPDIIHGAVFEGVLLATIAGTVGRVPIVIAEETSDPYNRSRKASFLLKMLSLLSDKVVGVSPATCEYLKNIAGIHASKIRLINNGVNINQFLNAESVQKLKDSLGITGEDTVIGSVGRLWNKVKQFTDLIEALHLLKNVHPNLKILLVGDGPDKEMIQKVIEEKGLSERVIMTGFQPNPHPYFQVMDIFAIVSKTESFGLVAVEAMNHNLPVIATKVGGLKSIVVDQETGYLVNSSSPKEIADAIKKMIANRGLMREMGQRGFERAQREYSAKRYVRDVNELYEELLLKKNVIQKIK